MNNEAIDVYGDGSQTRDFTYVRTVLDVVDDALGRGVRTEGAVNLAYGNRISLLTTIDLLKAHFPDLKVNFLGDRPGDVKNSQNDPVLLKKLFPGIKPTEFEVALNETVNWLKEFGQSVANGPATVD
jgi:UDP-glucose 4-epimerase